MIISASRRTDIPAFYTEWFFNRLQEGFALVRNPMNPSQVKKVLLDPTNVDCLIFWTKNPAPMLERLHDLQDYHYYFLFTVTPYGKGLEQNLPPKNDILQTFVTLSKSLGPHRVLWRYDPILLTPEYTMDYHFTTFDQLAGILKNHTTRCIISFLDLYRKTVRNMRNVPLLPLEAEEQTKMTLELARIARLHGLPVSLCVESLPLPEGTTERQGCIDGKLIAEITGKTLRFKKDSGQRLDCHCVTSTDIGAYDSCQHFCRYCYANSSETAVNRRQPLHNPSSPFLIG